MNPEAQGSAQERVAGFATLKAAPCGQSKTILEAIRLGAAILKEGIEFGRTLK